MSLSNYQWIFLQNLSKLIQFIELDGIKAIDIKKEYVKTKELTEKIDLIIKEFK